MNFVKFIRFFIKKIFYYYGWKIEKIYIQKSPAIHPPTDIELKILQNSNGIFHLGAHRGTEAPIYDWFGKKVIWIEANPQIYFDLSINIKKYPNQKSFCYLITDQINKKYKFNISNNDSASSSIFEFGELSTGINNLWPEKKKLRFIRRIELFSTTIDNFVNENKIDIKDYDHWVIDLQGAELLALKGSLKSLQSCKSILVEVSDGEVYKNSPNYKEIFRFLEFYNFKALNEVTSKHCNLLFSKNKI
jgi:FkbM family methyltransferase